MTDPIRPTVEQLINMANDWGSSQDFNPPDGYFRGVYDAREACIRDLNNLLWPPRTIQEDADE